MHCCCLVYSNALLCELQSRYCIWGYRCTVSSNLNAKNGFIHAHHHIL
uniref:Uncharacterized protein n=1 Tax=Anguilla anguilla TaxID=7936 RepID=A0A0E9ST34_ANGAN